MRILIFAAVAALAGCASADRAQAPKVRPGQAVAFYSNNDAEYQQAVQGANEWCHETYDAPAQYLTTRNDGTAGKVVTFGCVTR
jgi:hypothetical protein